jgi:hypothetical protein
MCAVLSLLDRHVDSVVRLPFITTLRFKKRDHFRGDGSYLHFTVNFAVLEAVKPLC